MKSRLPFFGLIRVSGVDTVSFLHNQLSNDIQNLAPKQACYATYNTTKGRVIANMLVLNRGEDILMAVAADLTERLIKRLRMYVLRAKVEFEVLNDMVITGEISAELEPQPAEIPTHAFAAFEDNGGIWSIKLPHGGILNIGSEKQINHYDAAEQCWNCHEIESGYPWISAATSETCVAQMLNQHTIGGVHFKKGCYPGQEIIARAQYRGQVKRGLAVLSATTLEAAGTNLELNGEEAGIIINSAPIAEGSINLAVIKHAAASGKLHDASGNLLQQQTLFFKTETPTP